ncbi:Gfo/Idh/MocA family protein [Paenibacillus hodogayensis]|uniref:Gfo/Idh/MocA family protein n=1 Tax=Paenibacillus hodogayensis TaxID=279208 RepID=A0ABV5VTT2_9BACL
MTTIRLALVGLGRFAQAHARIWSQLHDVEIVALCDSNPNAFAPFLQWFPEARCYSDWKEMIDQEKPDALDVLTPEHLHAGPVLYALAAGVHVFVEKPLAATPEEAAVLADAALKRERVLMVGHVLRFDVRYAEAKARIARGELGAIRSVYAKRNNGKAFFPIYNRISPVFILGIHDIDMMHWLMEDDVVEVTAVRTGSGHETEDLIWSMLKFSRGGLGILENNWLLPSGAPSFMDVRTEITGDDGSMTIRDPERGLEVIGGTSAEYPSFLSGYEIHGKQGGPLSDELAHFIACVKSGRPSDILRPHDAWKAVRVASAIRESAVRGQTIRLEERQAVAE